MLTFKWRGGKNLDKGLVRIESQMTEGADKFVNEAIDWLIKDITDNWSPKKSVAGQAPAIQTGNLDSAVKRGKGQGRAVGGRFADKKNIRVQHLSINTLYGNKSGGRSDYARELEEDMDRPFVAPALKRMETELEWMARRYIKLR